MKLTLENFRCYSQRTFELPDNGVTLLWGESGRGKTSIFKAIYFALYGVKGKEQTTTFGAKKSKVVLEVDEVVITRTRTPNHLLVKTPTFQGEDIVAQKWINDRFGSYFFHTSYLTQKCLDNFFTQSREARAEILRALSILSFDIDKLKAKNKEHVKERKQALLLASNEWKWNKQEMEQRKFSQAVDEPVFPLVLKDGLTTSDVIQREKKEQENNWKKLVIAQQNAQEKNKELQIALTLFANVVSLQSKLKDHYSFKLELETELAVEDINVSQADIDAQERLISIYELMIQFHDRQTQLTNLVAEQKKQNDSECQRIQTLIEANPYDENEMEAIDNEIDYLKHVKQAYEAIQARWHQLNETNKMKQVLDPKTFKWCCEQAIQPTFFGVVSADDKQQNITEISNSLAALESQLADVNKQLKFQSHKCPGCNINLAYVKECIIKHNPSELQAQKTLLQSQIDKTKLKLMEATKELSEIKKVYGLYQQLVSCIQQHEDYLDEDVSTIEDDIKKSQADGKEQTVYKSQLTQLQFELSQIGLKDKEATKYIEQEIKLVQKKLGSQAIVHLIEAQDKLVQCQQQLNVLKPLLIQKQIQEESKAQTRKKLHQLLSQINDVEAQLKLANDTNVEELKQQIVAIDEEIKQRQEKAERFEKRKGLLDKYQQEMEKYNEYIRLKTKLDTSLQTMNIRERGLTCAIQMSKLIIDAESSSLQSFLAQLNEECEKHMQVMFQGDLTMKVKYEHSSTEEENKKIYVDIELLRGTDEVPYESLSGGESDRCALAMFLAFNKLSKSKFLLLDECLSSLHAESVEDIVDHIKTEFVDRICVMTLHQTTKGIFDQIISLT